MTLEDVWHILQIMIHVDLEVYDPTKGCISLHYMFSCSDEELGIEDYEIGW